MAKNVTCVWKSYYHCVIPIYKIFLKLSNKNSSENIKWNYELAMVDKQIHLIYDSDNTLDTS